MVPFGGAGTPESSDTSRLLPMKLPESVTPGRWRRHHVQNSKKYYSIVAVDNIEFLIKSYGVC